MSEFIASPTMEQFMLSPEYVRVIGGPIGCVAPDTLILTEQGPRRIDSLIGPVRVVSWNAETSQYQLSPSGGAFPKGRDYLYRVSTQQGEFVAAAHHRVFCADGMYRRVESLVPGQSLHQCSQAQLQTMRANPRRLSSLQGEPHLIQKAVDSLANYAESIRQYGRLPPLAAQTGQVFLPFLSGAPQSFVPLSAQFAASRAGGRVEQLRSHSHPPRLDDLPEIGGSGFPDPHQHGDEACRAVALSAPHVFWSRLKGQLSHIVSYGHQRVREFVRQGQSHSTPTPKGTILRITREAVKEVYWDLQVLDTHNYVTVDGTTHHNSGKSVACCHELMRWATEQEPNAAGIRKTRFIITRNTADQLRSTTLKTILDWFPPEIYGDYKASEKTLYYTLRLPDNTIVQTEWMLIALDTPDDVRKALSLEATGLWGNESRELHPDVVDGLLMRVNRFPSMKDGGPTRPGAIFDTNMPDEDTWWQDKMDNPPRNWSIHVQPPAVIPIDQFREKYRKDPDEDTVIKSVEDNLYAVDPAHDNYDNLAKTYYPNTGEGKKEDFIRVYLRCEYGRALGGLPVFEKTFFPEKHIRRGLVPVQSTEYPLCVGLDFGRQPSAIIGQLTPMGQVIILGECLADNMGMEKFCKTKFDPYMAEHFPGHAFYIAPDPAGFQKTQLGELSPAAWLVSQGYKLVRPLTNDPEVRIQAVEKLLGEGVDAMARFVVDPDRAPVITKALKGKYRWKTTKAGDMANAKAPMKNEWSHPADALQYLCLVIEGGHMGRARQRGARQVTRVRAAGWT